MTNETGGGRPAPKGGKGSVLTTRITGELRAALEAEAERTGRTLSQVVEQWLEEARRGHASAEALLGGVSVAPAIRQLIAFTKSVEEHVGDPATDEHARGVLIHAWRHLAHALLPPVKIRSETFSILKLSQRLRRACAVLLEETRACLASAPAGSMSETTTALLKDIEATCAAVVPDEGMLGETNAAVLAQRLKQQMLDLPDSLFGPAEAMIEASDMVFTVWRQHTERLQAEEKLGHLLAREWMGTMRAQAAAPSDDAAVT